MSDSSDVDENTLTEPVRKKLKKLDRQLDYFNFLRATLIKDREHGVHKDLVRVKVGKQEFRCHRRILISNSEYFSALLKGNFQDAEQNVKTLPPEHVSECIFAKLLDAMYGEPLKIEDDVIPIFVASVYLQLTHFLIECRAFIRKHIEVIDVYELIMLPQLKLDWFLFSFVKGFICRNFFKLYPRFIGIPLDILEELLSDPELSVSNKEQMLDFARDWICYDLQHRKEHLSKICSLLKPSHMPSNRSDFASVLQSHLQNEFDVQLTLNTLLEVHANRKNPSELDLDVKSSSLFFIQPNDEAEIQIATLKSGTWNFWDQIQLPNTTKVLTKYEGAVVSNSFYFSAELELDDVIFRSFDAEKMDWLHLTSTRKMPECLITCDSTLYSYEDSLNDHQISFFEPVLNRWFKIPPVKYPRRKAAVVADGSTLYMVGGCPLKKISSDMPDNVIEMYDSRCRNWSRIIAPNDEKIGNVRCSKNACYLNNCIYLMNSIESTNSSKCLMCFDVRNNKWKRCTSKQGHNSIVHIISSLGQDVPGEEGIKFLTTIGQSVWLIYKNQSNATRVIAYSPNTGYTKVSNTDILVKPISLPYKA